MARTDPKTAQPEPFSSGQSTVGALLKADKATLVVTAEKDGKLRVSSSSWTEAIVVLPHEKLALRNVGGQLQVHKEGK